MTGHDAASGPEVQCAASRPDVEALLNAPQQALRAGRTAEAARLLQDIVGAYHDCAEAHLLLGNISHSRRDFEDARDCYTLAVHFRPAWWAPRFNLGQLAYDQGRYGEAIAQLSEAHALGADNARLHNALGAAYLRDGKPAEAVICFERALELEPDSPHAHNDLGYALFRELERFEQGAWHIEKALELDPGHVAALCNWTMVLSHRGDTQAALELCERLLTEHPDLSEARLNRALMLLAKGDFGRGWRDYEARKLSPDNPLIDDPPYPQWEGSDLEGRTLYVQTEQGIGDEIMFASCLPDVIARAGRCIAECSPKVQRLFSRSFPRALMVGRGAWRSSPAVLREHPDYRVAIGSLPRFLRNEGAAFPAHAGYLRADAQRVGYWRERLAAMSGRLKIGISWRGGLATSRRSLRSIPLMEWRDVLRCPDADFVSLQYTDCLDEIAAVERDLGVRVHHWREALNDYDETGALVGALDLVVSVQTAVVHLAGALGKPVWALIPAVPEWRYGARGARMIWYPSVELLRQEADGDWKRVLARVSERLRSRA